MKQFFRDVVTGDVSLEYLAARFSKGWRIATIEWVRESTEAPGPELPASARANLLNAESLPYGIRLSESGMVEENPLEATVLLLILEQIVKERRIQEIAAELNRQGYSNRAGHPWSASDVFNLMPRLIEAGPSLLKSDAWVQWKGTGHPNAGKPQ